jgi:hypothetical protein
MNHWSIVRNAALVSHFNLPLKDYCTIAGHEVVILTENPFGTKLYRKLSKSFKQYLRLLTVDHWLCHSYVNDRTCRDMCRRLSVGGYWKIRKKSHQQAANVLLNTHMVQYDTTPFKGKGFCLKHGIFLYKSYLASFLSVRFPLDILQKHQLQ